MCLCDVFFDPKIWKMYLDGISYNLINAILHVRNSNSNMCELACVRHTSRVESENLAFEDREKECLVSRYIWFTYS